MEDYNMSSEDLLNILQGVDNDTYIMEDSAEVLEDEDFAPPENISRDDPGLPSPLLHPSTSQSEFNWNADNYDPVVEPFEEFASGIDSGSGLTEHSTQFDFFSYFVDTAFVTQIVAQINRFHRYFVLNVDIRVHSRLQKWYDVTVPEFYIFLSICMLMTRNRHLSIEEHWSTYPLLFTPVFSNLMARNRFCSILALLHFSDPFKPSDSRLSKIEMVIKFVRNKFKSIITPFKTLCIDESIVPFKGRLVFKQYLPNKRNRFGIKLFVLCDVTSGIIIDFVVYCGADTEISDPLNLGVGGAVVISLIKDYFKSNRHLYIDNWYTSPRLLKYLADNNIYACGTVKPNRKGMPVFGKIKQGQMLSQSSPPLIALKWRDKKEVHMLSTIHNAIIVPTLKTDRATGLPKMKPLCIEQYSKNMGTVDTCDMMISSIKCIRKSIKWYKKMFFHVLDMSLLNGFYCWRLVKDLPNAHFAEYQLEVIRQIIALHNVDKILRTPHLDHSINPLRILPANTVAHLPTFQQKYQRCKQCSIEKKRKSTRYMCTTCKVYLCAAPCFKKFHTK